ncbi:MAG TPA: hypothetical protein VGB53_15155 [Rubricoccaceae bacterium]|jgi:hypothetical protein
MRRLGAVLLLASLAAAALSVPARAQESPFALRRAQPGDGPAAGYLRLRDAEAAFRGGERWDEYTQYRAQAAAALGLHAEALAWWDGRHSPVTAPAVVFGSPPRAADAAEWIAARADTARVVMVNEAHHDAASRLLTLALLPRLYAEGYRYFAAEAFAADSVLAAQPPYPTPAMGTYLGEPVFGEIVREALRLGYTLVPYEIEDGEEGGPDPQARRDSMQAVHLAERTVERDPAARVLVHAGFAHVYETADEYWHPMAAFFRERTGIDPLTVDQIAMSEHSTRAYDSVDYRAAESSLRGVPAVLLPPSGEPLRLGNAAPVDVQVVRPRTVYRDGRPTWMALGGSRVLETVPLPDACVRTICVAEVRLPGEPGSTPLDRVVAEHVREAAVYVPAMGPFEVTVVDGRTGTLLP